MLQQRCGRRGEYDVVEVDKDIGNVHTPLVDEEGRVGTRCGEANGAKMCTEALEPRTWRLSQAVKRLDQQAHVIWASIVDETYRLVTVDMLRQIAMEECILNVELVHRPPT